jgi:alanine racemase
MDMCMVDVTDIPGVAEGDEAVIIGSQGDLEISVEELADMCGTISYEILCGISQRVPRLYFRGGELLKVETLTSPLGLRAAVGAG